ncbi:hypothetical protein DTL21_16185 [Bremerella cremea]|uniref:SPOR domain-containing protein n=1 Tax=Blastopirellula marina TaxID=124 RepID=A0A2S8FS53_9BACT|nr:MULTISPECIES: hypothetical protein [Pirellulaceae]PQO35011.1 hypothetical protein C5Y83_16170 [Blastopirellula marina]RCS47512.1 hypothetical protein DTL21_16185 [Bremerella cremea]
MCECSHDAAGKWISVSAPGGMARQIIVDEFDSAEHAWKRVGTFADDTSVEKQLSRLKMKGVASRVISQSFCPTGL